MTGYLLPITDILIIQGRWMSGGHPFSADRNEVEMGGLSDGVDHQYPESNRLYGETSY